LKYIENLIGKANFQKIFQEYIVRFTKKSVSYNEYINVFNEKIKEIYGEKEAEEVFQMIDWNKWIFTPGLVCKKLQFSINILFNNN